MIKILRVSIYKIFKSLMKMLRWTSISQLKKLSNLILMNNQIKLLLKNSRKVLLTIEENQSMLGLLTLKKAQLHLMTLKLSRSLEEGLSVEYSLLFTKKVGKPSQ